MNELVLPTKITDVIAEYNHKLANVENTLKEFEKASETLKTNCCVSGTWGNVHIDTGRVYEHNLKDCLLKSAWYHIYKGLNIEMIASAKDKRLFEIAMASPPEFTIENIRATLGPYILNPMDSILRGLAEVFCSLDQSYKSHDKVKIGVEGLPKRVILSGFNSYSGYGKDRMKDVLNAIAQYQRKPLVTWAELNAIEKNGDALLHDWESKEYGEVKQYPARGVWLKKYKNGNGHLYFTPETLLDINRALAEYYGEVLADCHEEKPTERQESTAVSKDLQYYPTPVNVAKEVVSDIYITSEDRVLEPSCGDGRLLDEIRKKTNNCLGIEINPKLAQESINKGHKVHIGNFLETVPEEKYDFVVMNPPF